MKHGYFSRVLPLALCGVLALAGAGAAAPPPPPRPAEFGKPAPAAPTPSAPDRSTPTATTTNACESGACPPAGGREPVDVDLDSLKPYNLPAASRAQMRACGEQWRDMKLAGAATGLTWRIFAEKCLAK
jgi:hypothetical protein